MLWSPLTAWPHTVPRAIGPQDLDSCGPRQLHVLYSKACVTFRNMSRPEYLERIRAFLGEPGHPGRWAEQGAGRSLPGMPS